MVNDEMVGMVVSKCFLQFLLCSTLTCSSALGGEGRILQEKLLVFPPAVNYVNQPLGLLLWGPRQELKAICSDVGSWGGIVFQMPAVQVAVLGTHLVQEKHPSYLPPGGWLLPRGGQAPGKPAEGQGIASSGTVARLDISPYRTCQHCPGAALPSALLAGHRARPTRVPGAGVSQPLLPLPRGCCVGWPCWAIGSIALPLLTASGIWWSQQSDCVKSPAQEWMGTSSPK